MEAALGDRAACVACLHSVGTTAYLHGTRCLFFVGMKSNGRYTLLVGTRGLFLWDSGVPLPPCYKAHYFFSWGLSAFSGLHCILLWNCLHLMGVNAYFI